jgi:hypothetical protein
VVILTRRFALELGQHGITVNTVAPGFVRTDMQMDALIAQAPEVKPPSPKEEEEEDDSTNVEVEIERLARLSAVEYEQQRKGAAEKLGMRASILDKLVQAERVRLGDDDDEPAPALYEHWNVGPANAPVDTGIMLRALKEAIRRYAFMSEEFAVAVTLWIVFSWLHEHMTHSPMLLVTSAERDSGKSTLLGVINFLARRSLQIVDISGAALFRSITKWEPTLIVDEADDALADNPDLRSVINSGWTRGQGVPRCHPDTHEPEIFSTFAPKIVAMKGRNLPDTTLSRSIIITMRPRRASDPKEHAADFDHLDNETFTRLRSQLMRWVADNADAIVKATPEIPPGFHNRRRANWVPLLAIAEAGGGEWKTKAWTAARAIEAVAATFDPSIGVQLLWAIKVAFKEREEDENRTKDKDRITSVGLMRYLDADETAPWATYNKGKSISQRQIAGLLKPYGIRPRNIRLDDGSIQKGYLREWFTDVFERYCTSPDTQISAQTPDSSATPLQPLFSQENSQKSSATGPIDVADKNGANSLKNNDCSGAADRNGGPGHSAHIRTAKTKSDDLPSTGPPVETPDLGPDPLDEHGTPATGNGGTEPSLSSQRIRELADWYRDQTHRRYSNNALNVPALDAELRAILRKECASPEQVEVEFGRVTAVVFAA